MPRGRPKKDTEGVKIHLPSDLISSMLEAKPMLRNPNPVSSRSSRFRHGALSTYVTRLILDDLRKSEKEENSGDLFL